MTIDLTLPFWLLWVFVGISYIVGIVTGFLIARNSGR